MKSSIPDLFTSSIVDLMLKTSDNQLKAELLGNFFSSVFVKEPSWTWDLNFEDKPTITEHLSIELTKEVTRKKINELNTNKSPGPDNMHPRVVKGFSSIACKILESIIRDSPMKYLMSNNILTNKQFGFMRGRSTILQLLKVVDKLSEVLDKGGVVDVIYCDFMKAFNTVPHQRLTELLI